MEGGEGVCILKRPAGQQFWIFDLPKKRLAKTAEHRRLV